MSTLAGIPHAPGALPFLGHAIPLMRDPLRFMASLPAYGPLVTISLGPRPAVVVCDPALTNTVLRDGHTFDKGGLVYERAADLLGNGVGTCPHAEHRRQRRLCQPAFHPTRLPGYASVAAAAAENLAASWSERQIVDVNHAMMTLVGRTAVQSLFALHLPTHAAQAVIDDCATVSGGILRRLLLPAGANRAPTPANRRYKKALTRLRATVDAIITQRRADEADHGDLLYALLHAVETDENDGPQALADTEVTDQVLTFLFAGIDTSAALLAWALYELGRNPEIQERLHQQTTAVLDGEPPGFEDIPRLAETRNVVTETLRRHAPTWMFTRATTRPTRLGAAALPAATTVLLSPYILHNRPDQFPDPDRFDPSRRQDRQPDRTAYLPFGSGSRKCIGDRFAENLMTLALAVLTTRWCFTPVTARPAKPSATILLTPHHLRLQVTRRH